MSSARAGAIPAAAIGAFVWKRSPVYAACHGPARYPSMQAEEQKTAALWPAQQASCITWTVYITSCFCCCMRVLSSVLAATAHSRTGRVLQSSCKLDFLSMAVSNPNLALLWPSAGAAAGEAHAVPA